MKRTELSIEQLDTVVGGSSWKDQGYVWPGVIIPMKDPKAMQEAVKKPFDKIMEFINSLMK